MGLETSDRILGTAKIMGVERGAQWVNLWFSILSCLSLDSSVECGIPTLAAAPFDPATFRLLSAKSASKSSFPSFWRVSVRMPDDWGRGASWLLS